MENEFAVADQKDMKVIPMHDWLFLFVNQPKCLLVRICEN